MTPYTLYWSHRTGAFAPQAILEEIGARYETLVVDTAKGEHRQPEYLALNPRGQIPALKLPDGSILTESAAILLHLGDAHPDAALIPAVDDSLRPQLYRWLFFMTCNIYDPCLRYYYTERYSAQTGTEVEAGIRAAATADLSRAWSLVEAQLQEHTWLLGERFGAIDIYLVMLLQWMPEKPNIMASSPGVSRVFDQVRQRPPIARIWQQNHGDA